jgi:hypothetical protein
MRTVAKTDGRTIQACCVRCVLTVAQQTGKEVQFLSVNDYDTGKQLAPDKAFYVDGSQVEVCSTPQVKPGEEMVPSERVYDRCAPSVIAFANEDKARAFIAQHGGSLKKLNELVSEAASQPGPAEGHHHD